MGVWGLYRGCYVTWMCWDNRDVTVGIEGGGGVCWLDIVGVGFCLGDGGGSGRCGLSC